MSSFRTRCSPPPARAKGENDPRVNQAPRAAWSQQPSDASTGTPPNELWGVAARDMSKPRRKRSEKAAARRRAKQAAKRANVTLKSYLRSEGTQGQVQKRKKGKSK